VHVATLVHQITAKEAASPERVKVVLSAGSNALYFSRSVIPFAREQQCAFYWGHTGIYAFRLPALRRFTSLPTSPLEQTEKLEQLRLLENDIPIRAVKTDKHSVGVDKPEDLKKVLSFMRQLYFP
jgi:3-deoxy-manno-octulosonate cytidylyltransferase (CMP-KDO synthetase)